MIPKVKTSIAVTVGDPNGIGPEVALKALHHFSTTPDLKIYLIGPQNIIQDYQKALNITLPPSIHYIPMEDHPCHFGKVTQEAGSASYQQLQKSIDLFHQGKIQGVVTAPVCKEAINISGKIFKGQTELLKVFTSATTNPEMLFEVGHFRVVPVTRHVPLSEVSKLLTCQRLIDVMTAVHHSLQKDFNIQKPRIGVAAINPHAGEAGLLGHEELTVIKPAIEQARQKGMEIQGPFAADTLYKGLTSLNLVPPYDCYIAMYHDQALIPVKLVGFEQAVNITINLPIVRTSPAHGTAFDIAGSLKASHLSMLQSVKTCYRLVQSRINYRDPSISWAKESISS